MPRPGVLLRQEGLYSSHLSEWRKARDSGALAGLAPAARSGSKSAGQVENAKLRARAERAERELAKTKAALEIVGKAHASRRRSGDHPAVLLLADQTSTARACALLGKPRGSHYRDRRPVPLVSAQRAAGRRRRTH